MISAFCNKLYLLEISAVLTITIVQEIAPYFFRGEISQGFEKRALSPCDSSADASE